MKNISKTIIIIIDEYSKSNYHYNRGVGADRKVFV